ncbi:MAG: squalene--hopene cyclase [Planctomycetia bacterium]|nr:squalene--hopene cyclase [Planctomycetia bacterium]
MDPTSPDTSRLQAALDTARTALLEQRELAGSWTGELSSSALSTATAVSALAVYHRHAPADADKHLGADWQERLSEKVMAGLNWLAAAQNPDGGFGDTDRSLSNVATSMLAQAAFHLTVVPSRKGDILERLEHYIASQGGVAGVRARYGKDKTFAAPILANAALAGLVSWESVPALPLELACFPQGWYRFLKLPVVSYAVPALVAIGLVRLEHRPPRFPLLGWFRRRLVDRALHVVEEMLPRSGGFLEATPITSFVVMSLAASGKADHVVTQKGVGFLLNSALADGSWLIDTNLATWNTTLALSALTPLGDSNDVAERGAFALQIVTPEGQRHAAATETSVQDKDVQSAPPSVTDTAVRSGAALRDDRLDEVHRESLLEWLLSCQHRQEHRYTGAPPGGWAWTDLSGGVPDADDTCGALLALSRWPRPASDDERILDAACAGCRWLLDLQNRDGGWPTFCRGWGTMPFDRSATDLTAHALRALWAWKDRLRAHRPRDRKLSAGHVDRAMTRGFAYLARSQRDDGCFVPLWFGNQYDPREENPVYGTARVLLAYRDLNRLDAPAAKRAVAWLVCHQNADGGWGRQFLREDLEAAAAILRQDDLAASSRRAADAPKRPRKPPEAVSSVEETALAVEALLGASGPSRASSEHEAPAVGAALRRGLDWLVESVESNRWRECSPIGFYFAKLWYYEKLYPMIFTVSALQAAMRCPAFLPSQQHAPREPALPHATAPQPAEPSPAPSLPLNS